MQSKQERAEAAALYPSWGDWLTRLEREAIALHGYGWAKRSLPADVQGLHGAGSCGMIERTDPIIQHRNPHGQKHQRHRPRHPVGSCPKGHVCNFNTSDLHLQRRP